MKEVVQFGHPDTDELNAFMEHALPAEARERTLAHLAVCADCRMVVMLAGEPEVSVEAGRVESRRWWRVPVWQWGLAGAVLAGGLVLVTVRRGSAPVVVVPEERAAVVVPAAPVAGSGPVLPPVKMRDKVMGAKESMAGREVAPAHEMAGMAAAGSAQGRAGAGAGSGVGAEVPQPSLQQAMSALPVARVAVPALPAPAPLPVPLAVPAPKLPVAMAGESAGTGFAAAPMMAARAVARTLPSGLAVVSEASGAGALVALDGGNHLYVTRDGGAHWVAVAAQWNGKAIRVGLVGAVPAGAVSAEMDSNASATVLTGASLDAMASDEPGSAVTGLVTDWSGALIPGVVVALRDAATKAVVRTAVTDKDGRYTMAAPLGNYSLEAQKQGFAREVIAIAVPAGTSFNQNMRLAVGAASTVVTVQSSNADLATTNGVTEQMLGERKANAPMLAKQRAVAKVEPVFELVTENGEHWVSSDGSLWKKK